MSFTKTLTIEMLVIMWPTLEGKPLQGLLLDCGALRQSPHEHEAARDVRRTGGGIPVLEGARALPHQRPEPAAERTEAGEAHRVAHLGDGEVRRAQQVLGSLDPPLRDVLGRGEAVGRLEEPQEVVLRQTCRRREPLEVERLRVLPVGEVTGAAQVREDVVGRSHGPGRHAAIVRHLRSHERLLGTTDPRATECGTGGSRADQAFGVAPQLCLGLTSGAPCGAAPSRGSGLASTPASLRCSGVIGAGAAVSGSKPPPDFGKAMTSRIDSEPARRATMRSQPNAIPPCGGAPNAKASRRKPNFSCASSCERPMTWKTRSWMSRRWIRMEPPPISLPLQTMSYASASAAPGSESEVSISSGRGAVNAWCTAVQLPVPTAMSPALTASAAGSNSGASSTQQSAHAASSINPTRRPISSRVAPSSDCAEDRSPAAKKMQSPGFAPAISASPDRSA